MQTIESAHEQYAAEAPFRVVIDSGWAGVRLDQYLAQRLSELSRSQIASAIKNGSVDVDGEVRKGSYRLKAGQTVTGRIDLPRPPSIAGECIDFEVLHEDEHILLLSKPPGLVVHPGSGNLSGTLVNGLVQYCRDIASAGDSSRPGIVHRLDKDTSGIMIIAKNDRSHRQLVESFKNHTLEKEYITLVHGIMAEKKGRLSAPIGRHPVQRQKMSVLPHGGKHAVTDWQVVEEFHDKFSLVRVKIETGRTHQIRVHMAYLGYPVAGDELYGRKRTDSLFPRQMLHALRLSFTHPVTGLAMTVEAPLWHDLAGILEKLGWKGQRDTL